VFIAVLAIALGLLPVDAQQGQVYRIIYVHVPAAWMSMFLYTVASGYALMFWVWGTDVSGVMMKAFLPTGAWMTAVALVTGSLWGKPTWGTYWVWDARLTSELLLLFIYLGLIALSSLVEDETKVDRVLAVAIVIGLVNIPLIYFSVIYWNTLHQGMSLGAPGASRMAPEMRWTLLACVFGLWMICAGIVLARARIKLLERCIESAWVKGVRL
jgi:heme exporter protein C